jgi:DNA repair protein RAD50
LDAKIEEAKAPIDRLDSDYKQAQSELDAKISGAQRSSQSLNMNVDKLETINKAVERYDPFFLLVVIDSRVSFSSYVRNKSAKALKECGENIEQFQKEIQDLVSAIEDARAVISKLDKEINESGASVTNLRSNVRLRRLIRDIAEIQNEIDSHDMDEAAKAKRTFEDQYKVKKAQESELQSRVYIAVLLVYLLYLMIFFTVCSYCG